MNLFDGRNYSTVAIPTIKSFCIGPRSPQVWYKKTLNIRTIHFWWVNFTVKYKLLWISDTEINQYLKCHRLETFSFSFELPIDACFTVKI